MDAQHGGRALDSYLEDPSSILLPSFQRGFFPSASAFFSWSSSSCCSVQLDLVQDCRRMGWGKTAWRRERGGPKGQKITAQTQVKNSSALVLFQIFYYSLRKCVFLLIKHIQMPSAVVGLLCRRQR